MRLVKLSAAVAVASVFVMALMGPTGARAGSGPIPVGVAPAPEFGVTVGAFHWGPSPPYYPYYHYGTYGVPVGWSGPFWAPDAYGCDRHVVTTRHGRRVRACE